MCFHRTIFLGQLEGDKIVQDKALIISFEESEASLPTMTTQVKESLAMGADENIILTDSQVDTPGTQGLWFWVGIDIEQVYDEIHHSSSTCKLLLSILP